MTTELDNLAAMVANADSGANEIDMLAKGPEVDETGKPLPPPPDFGSEAAGIVDMVAAMLAGYAPRTQAVWTPAAKQRTAEALTPVLEKYGLSMGGMPCELVLLITAGPLVWQSARIVADQIQQDKAQAVKTVEHAAQPQTAEQAT